MTELTSQPGISVLPAGPQSALAQHATPVALTAKQFATAVLSSARLLNDDDDDGGKSETIAPHVAAVSIPALQDDVPDTVYPELHAGWHDEPCARVEVQSFRAPLATAADASHELPLHTAVSVSVPAVHDLVPERVYPVLHVGVHDAPSARVVVQLGPGAPFAIEPPALHGTRAVHMFGGPAMEEELSTRLKAASHAVAPVNMFVL